MLWGADPKQDAGVTHVVKTKRVVVAGEPTSAETTRSTEAVPGGTDRSIVGRVFDGSTPSVLFRILLAAVMTFFLAGLVQRTLLGEFAISVGPLSLGALSPVTEATAGEVADLINDSPDLAEFISRGGIRGPQPLPRSISIEDERMGLLSIRIDLEERLRNLAAAASLDRDIRTSRLPARLAMAGAFDFTAAESLEKFLEIGDRISAGAKIEPEAAEELQEQGYILLYALGTLRDRLMRQKEDDVRGV
jgi:hypothetical protein